MRRVLVRSRRRKPRPPSWWVAVVMLVLFAALAIWCAADGNWWAVGSTACNGVVWWRALHSPPHYWDPRAFWRWWPPAMMLSIAGVVL